MKPKENIEIKKVADVVTVIDEPTYVIDMEKLLARYAKKLLRNKEQRFKCDNDKCGRILWSKNTRPFKCSSCGHGTMRPAPPKVYCCECGEPIYFNVNSYMKVVCDRCTAKKVEEVEELERKFGRQIRGRRQKARKGKKVDRKREPLGIIRNEKDYRYALELRDEKEDLEQAKSSHKELVEARKKKGWSQKTLANYLGCSVNYLYQMEKGRKPLNLKAQEFVKVGLKFPKKKKKKKEKT